MTAHAIAELVYNLRSCRISSVDRIVCDVSVEIDLVFISDRIGLQEAAKGRRVEAGFVVIHAEVGLPRLAGILKAAEVIAARNTIFVISVDAKDVGSRRVGDERDASLPVGAQDAFVAAVKASAFVPRDRIVGGAVGAVDVAAQEIAASVILADQCVAIVEEARGTARP